MEESWKINEKEQFKVREWIEQQPQCLQVIYDSANKNEVQASENMKRNYYRKAKPRKFEVGSMVTVRVLGICGKINDTCDGPYEVHKRVGEVYYKVMIPNVKGKKEIGPS